MLDWKLSFYVYDAVMIKKFFLAQIILLMFFTLANAEKNGFDTKLFVAHPFIKGKKLPVFVANFILMD